MSLDRPTRSIRMLQTDRTSEDRLRDKRRSSHMRRIKEILTKNLHCVYLASFWRKGSKIAFWFDSVDWFDV